MRSKKNRTVKRRTGSYRQQTGITCEYDYCGIWIRFHYRGGVADIRLLEFRERGDDWGICWCCEWYFMY